MLLLEATFVAVSAASSDSPLADGGLIWGAFVRRLALSVACAALILLTIAASLGETPSAAEILFEDSALRRVTSAFAPGLGFFAASSNIFW